MDLTTAIFFAFGGTAAFASAYSMYLRSNIQLVRTRWFYRTLAGAFAWAGILHFGVLFGFVGPAEYASLVRPVGFLILGTPYVLFIFRVRTNGTRSADSNSRRRDSDVSTRST